jgi:hypothetical protein
MTGITFDWTVSLMPELGDAFSYPYDPHDGREDLAAGFDMLRIARGGAWAFDWTHARAACRYANHPACQLDVIGLRVVLPAGDPP